MQLLQLQLASNSCMDQHSLATIRQPD